MNFSKKFPSFSKILLFFCLGIEIWLVFKKGDRWDYLNQLILLILYFAVQFRGYQKTGRINLFIFVLIEFIFLGGINKVEGYADPNDYFFYYVGIFLGILAILFIRAYSVKRRLFYVVVCTLLFFHPVFNLPGMVLRQFSNSKKITGVPLVNLPETYDSYYSFIFTKELPSENKVVGILRYDADGPVYHPRREIAVIFDKASDGRLNFLQAIDLPFDHTNYWRVNEGTETIRQFANIDFLEFISKIKFREGQKFNGFLSTAYD